MLIHRLVTWPLIMHPHCIITAHKYIRCYLRVRRLQLTMTHDNILFYSCKTFTNNATRSKTLLIDSPRTDSRVFLVQVIKSWMKSNVLIIINVSLGTWLLNDCLYMCLLKCIPLYWYLIKTFKPGKLFRCKLLYYVRIP